MATTYSEAGKDPEIEGQTIPIADDREKAIAEGKSKDTQARPNEKHQEKESYSWNSLCCQDGDHQIAAHSLEDT